MKTKRNNKITAPPSWFQKTDEIYKYWLKFAIKNIDCGIGYTNKEKMSKILGKAVIDFEKKGEISMEQKNAIWITLDKINKGVEDSLNLFIAFCIRSLNAGKNQITKGTYKNWLKTNQASTGLLIKEKIDLTFSKALKRNYLIKAKKPSYFTINKESFYGTN